MNVKTSIEGANSLTKNALDHCIFPITHRDDVQKYGPMIMASGSGVTCRRHPRQDLSRHDELDVAGKLAWLRQ